MDEVVVKVIRHGQSLLREDGTDGKNKSVDGQRKGNPDRKMKKRDT